MVELVKNNKGGLSIGWDYLTEKRRHRKKTKDKRRKLNKIAKKSRKINRK